MIVVKIVISPIAKIEFWLNTEKSEGENVNSNEPLISLKLRMKQLNKTFFLL